MKPLLIQYRWYVLAAGAVLVLTLVFWLVPSSRVLAQGMKEVVLGSDAPPVTIVTDGGASDQLAERLAGVEAELAALKHARQADAELIAGLQKDYQLAVQEVAAAHDTFVKEAQQVVRSSGSVSAAPATQTAPAPGAPTASGRISLNKASAAQLDSFPGIGPAYAQRIVDYRTEHGPFRSIDDLTNVQGIGPATVEKIRDLVEL